MSYKTIIISDLHLGSKASRTDDIIKFLEQNNFEIVAIHSNDIFTNEVNIIFKNKSPKTALYQKSWKIN
jgi:UDP-2,3-diacylglucosamine pyrophosphatase LpxH